MAVVTLVPLPLVLGIKEEARPAERTFQWRAFGSFKRVNVIFLALMGFVLFHAAAGANHMINPFLKKTFEISLARAGLYTTVWGLGSVFGGIFGGRLYSRIGMYTSSLSVILAGFAGTTLLSLIPDQIIAWLLIFLFGLVFGMQKSVYLALAMRFTDTRIAASMFSIFMVFLNVATGTGVAVSGLLSDTVGFRLTFGLLGTLNLLALPMLPKIFRKDEIRLQ